jgi:hypothetical protein
LKKYCQSSTVIVTTIGRTRQLNKSQVVWVRLPFQNFAMLETLSTRQWLAIGYCCVYNNDLSSSPAIADFAASHGSLDYSPVTLRGGGQVRYTYSEGSAN